MTPRHYVLQHSENFKCWTGYDTWPVALWDKGAAPPVVFREGEEPPVLRSDKWVKVPIELRWPQGKAGEWQPGYPDGLEG